MAAANSDQENVLLQSDEGSPSAPPPAGRLPFKAALAVGLCIFAAGLAGAVTIWRPAARAPAKIGHPWSAIGLHDLEHLSDECQEQYEALARQAQADGRVQDVEGSEDWPDCTAAEQTCTIDIQPIGVHKHCWPAICKEENILKQIESNYGGFDVDVSCTIETLEDTSTSPAASEDDEADETDEEGEEYQCCFIDLVIQVGCHPEKPWYIPWCPADETA